MHLITTSRDTLLNPLQSVSGIVEKRHTLPILSNVLIEKRSKQLTVLATDVEIQIKTLSDIEASGNDAAITVSMRKLHDILRSLPEDSQVQLDIDDNRMIVKAGKSRFQLQTLPAADYPKLTPPTENMRSLKVSQKEFKQQLAQVFYAMAQQDIRYYLNGLLVIADTSLLRMVATDGHRLAYAERPLEGVSEKIDVILPRKTVLELSRQLADSDEPLEILLGNNQAVFRFGKNELISKLIDGKFPDFERVIPQNHTKILNFARQPLLASLQRAAILTNDKFRGVRFVLADKLLKIICSNADQEEALEELEIDYQGEGVDIGFNVTYLIEMLNNVSTSEIVIHLQDTNSSAMLTLPNNNQFKYVVMPMRI